MPIDPRQDRNVIPRWRPLGAIDRRDIRSGGRFASTAHVYRPDDFQADVDLWIKEPNLASASDIFDTYILTGKVGFLNQASRLFRKHSRNIPPRLRDALEFAYVPEADPLEIRKLIAFKETDTKYIYRSISILKRRVQDFPRDGLSYLEMARLYTVLGEFELADRALGIARSLAPDDRVILRASLRFYDTVVALEDGLKIIRRSERLKFDPWIQSAEIATSTLLGKDSKIATRKLLTIGSDGFVPRECTELAMALATLDRQSGIRERKVFQLVSQALPHATENGFAQAIWLSDNSSRGFAVRYPDFEPSFEALEAQVQITVDARNFEHAVGLAELWLEDQPFNLRAILQYLDLSSVHTRPTSLALATAARLLHVYAENWHVLNACVLVLTEGGDFANAELAVSRLERTTPDGPSRAFVEAAKGFLAFAKGDFQDGRRHYESATRISFKAKRNDLIVDSTIFWFRCEASNGLLSEQYISEMIGMIDRAIKHIGPDHRPYLSLAWHSVKSYVAPSESGESAFGSLLLKEIATTSFEDSHLLLS